MDYQKKTAITAEAAKQNFIDPNIVVQLIDHNVQIDGDGKMVIVGDTGEQKFNSAFQPMSLAEYVADFATQRSYLVRGDTKTGAGSTTASLPGAPTIKLTQLFGRESNAALANKLALTDPGKYKALRAQAVAEGLVS